MSELWFYGQNGVQRGPVVIEALRTLAASGELKPTDLVWHEGMTDWVPASTVPGLFVAAPVAPPPPPPGTPIPPSPMEYAPAPYVDRGDSGRAIGALVTGILSLFACGCPFGGLVLGIVAIALGISVRPGPSRGLAVTGMVLGVMGVLLSFPRGHGFMRL